MSYPGDPAAGQQPQYPAYGDPNQGGFQSPAASPFGQPQPQSAPPAQQPYPAPPVQQQQPYSSPPAAGYGPDPAASAPYSSPPGGGYGYDPNAAGLPPTSGAYGPTMPTSGPVGGLGGPPPSGPPKSKMVPVFASLMVVFLVVAAIFGVLFITKNGDYNDQKKAAQTKEAQLSGDLKKTQDDLKKAQDELAASKRDLTGAQGQADELKRQKGVISQCIRLLGEAGDASRAGNAALAAQKEAEAEPICNEAGRYLD